MRTPGTIRGYCSVYNETSCQLGDDTPFKEIIRPGAYRFMPGVISATVLHGGVQCATTWNRSLRLWLDNHGLAFELDIEASLSGIAVRNMVASGANSVSIGLKVQEQSITIDAEGHRLHEVTRASIDHIALTGADAAAYAGACCWIADMPTGRMQPHIKAASRRWSLGRIGHEQKKSENRAMLARYYAKADAGQRRSTGRWKPEPVYIPPMPEAMRTAMMMATR
jgi:phage head maturation protease